MATMPDCIRISRNFFSSSLKLEIGFRMGHLAVATKTQTRSDGQERSRCNSQQLTAGDWLATHTELVVKAHALPGTL